jgi:hypothetical protein
MAGFIGSIFLALVRLSLTRINVERSSSIPADLVA